MFPVAGLGTRFLPATKAVPKELLPVVDKPLIQYAVEEVLAAGVDTLIMVTRGDKRAIHEHFARSEHLERHLADRGQEVLLERVRDILPANVRLESAIQPQPLGLGHAVLCAQELVAGEPFAVILPDDLVRSPGQGCISQLIELHRVTGASVVGVERIERQLSRRYGVAAVKQTPEHRLRISELVEKPSPEEAPSDLGVVGRYVLEPAIFDYLRRLGGGAGGEIQLTDAIASLMQDHPVYACAFEGRRFDCGQRLGLIEATLAFAMDDQELGPSLRTYLESLLAPPGLD